MHVLTLIWPLAIVIAGVLFFVFAQLVRAYPEELRQMEHWIYMTLRQKPFSNRRIVIFLRTCFRALQF